MKFKRFLIMLAVFVTVFSALAAFGGCEEPEMYTITFDAGGGTVDPTTKVVVFYEKVGELPVPKKEGCSFSHWALKRNGKTTVFDSETVYVFRADETLTAVYDYNVTLELEYEIDGETVKVSEGGYTGARKFTALYGDKLSRYITYINDDKLSNSNYAFSGWIFVKEDGEVINLSLGTDCFVESIFGNETDITIKAKYVPEGEVWTPLY